MDKSIVNIYGMNILVFSGLFVVGSRLRKSLAHVTDTIIITQNNVERSIGPDSGPDLLGKIDRNLDLAIWDQN